MADPLLMVVGLVLGVALAWRRVRALRSSEGAASDSSGAVGSVLRRGRSLRPPSGAGGL